MRGFKIDATRASLRTNRISQQNDEIAVQSTTATTIANTRNAYWDLVFAIQAVEAAQNSLDISNKLVQDNQARVEIGTLAPIDITSAQAEAANRRLTLVQAQATVRTAELALKRLIVSGTDDPLWSLVDQPGRSPGRDAGADQRRRRGRARAARAHRRAAVAEQPQDQRHQPAEPGGRDQAAAEPDVQLRADRARRPDHVNGARPDHRADLSQTPIPSGYLDALRNIFGLDVAARSPSG